MREMRVKEGMRGELRASQWLKSRRKNEDEILEEIERGRVRTRMKSVLACSDVEGRRRNLTKNRRDLEISKR